MKKFVWLCLLCCLSACGLPSQDNKYFLYYVNDYTSTGEVLHAVARYLPQNHQEITVKDLVEAHLRYGLEEDVESPFPLGTQLLAWEMGEDGVVVLHFSSVFGEVSEVNRTVAQFALVETLAQLEGVSGVRIYVQGEEAPSPLLCPGDVWQ